MYISIFVLAFLKLFEEALEALGRRVIYLDTDSVMFVAMYRNQLIHPDTTVVMVCRISFCWAKDLWSSILFWLLEHRKL